MSAICSAIARWKCWICWVTAGLVSPLVDRDATPVRFEEGAEIIKCGILKKKASKNPINHWQDKYVIITIGKLIWFPLSSSMITKGDIIITDKMRKSQHFMSRCPLSRSPLVLDENTEPRCSLNRKKNVHHVFDVIYKTTSKTQLDLSSIEQLESYVKSASSSTAPLPSTHPVDDYQTDSEKTVEKHFMCQSDEERDSWLRAIRQARLGRHNDPTMWFSQHIFTAVRNLIGRAKQLEDIERILNAIVNVPLRIPVYFIQSISQGYRGPTLDPQLTQVMRDLNRETVVLGERTFQATLGDSDTYGFPSKMLFLLMESIRRKDEKLMACDLLRFAREVLLHTYRSQTGGDCFDALNALLNNTNLIMIIPTQCQASKNPIRIDVTDTIPSVCDVVVLELLHG